MGHERQNFSIDVLSRQTGVNIETVRYYEKIGLMPAPPRTEGGYQLFSGEHLKQLAFIGRSRELGFTLDEIRNLLGMVEGGYTCGAVQQAALANLAQVRRKITDLRRLQRTLAKTAARCEAGDAPECPIMDALFEHRRSG
jgi:MerR family mercuric resistance operon transcriptional regulator